MDDDGRQDDVSDTILLVVPEKRKSSRKMLEKFKIQLTLSQVSLGQWQGFDRW